MEEPGAAELTPDGCEACGVTDTAPKHTVAYGPGPDGWNPVTRHFDCCSAAGCPDQSCTRALQLSGYLKDQALRDWIIAGGMGNLKAGI